MTPLSTLVEPTVELKDAFYRYCEAFHCAGETPRRLEDLAHLDFAAFIRKLQAESQGIEIAPGFVPSTTYWLVRQDGTILGNSSLRHCLTSRLKDLGGNIGYAIHPIERCKGYGTLILKLTLEKAREKGLRQVLITCDTDNLASASVILKNGGVLASQGISKQTGKLVSRYWINLPNRLFPIAREGED